MFNVLLDMLPTEWNGFRIDSDFEIGIMISQCMSDDDLTERERISTAISLLFCDKKPPLEDAVKAVYWFLNEFTHDNHTKPKTSNKPGMDFDIDQWRIYAAFKSQYDIDLNNEKLHWFTFMGLLTTLDECAFTRVVDIRQKKINSKMSGDERKAIAEAKKVYEISTLDKSIISTEDKEKEIASLEIFNQMRGTP